jgi:hypothetical protein
VSSAIEQGWGLDPGFSYVRTGDGPSDFDCVYTGYDPQVEKDMLAYAQRRYEEADSLKSSQNQEELARQTELSTEASKSARWIKQDELRMHPSRMGKILTASEFISILQRKCKLNCWYTDTVLAQTGFLALVVTNNTGTEAMAVCGVQPGAMPEYSVMYFDQHDCPTKERYRGWRTVLLKLILKGIITEEKAHAAFGRPDGPAARRYLEILYGARNAPVE